MLDVFKKKSDLPEYLSHYGMHRAPFSAAIEDDMYYADPVRQQRLDILLHLTQNTNELLVVIGEEGTGKTTFINQFLHNTAEHWKVCFIEGHKMMSEEQFLQRVYMGFNIAHASVHKGTMLSNLRKRLENMLNDALPIIMVIDDAHLFSTKVLALILDIASIKNSKTGGSVRVILACEPQIKILLAEPVLEDSHNLIVRKIDLPPLDETHTGEYLHHRLTQAGMVVEQFLTKTTISRIFKSSDGVPRKINEAADKLLFDTTPVIRRNSNIESARKSPGLKIFVISLFIAAMTGIVLYIYTSELEHDVDHRDITNDPKEITTPLELPPANDADDKSEDLNDGIKAVEAVDPMQALKDELAGKSEPAQKVTTAVDSQNKASDNPQSIASTGTAQTPALPVTPPLTPPVTTTQSQQPGTDSNKQLARASGTAKTENQPADTNAALKGNDWVLQQDPDHFTLQLVAARQKQTITNFIKKYNLSGNLIYFSSSRNGRIWHNLAIGVYPDRTAANQASKKLPASLASVKPWIRQFKTIQSEIQKLAQP